MSVPIKIGKLGRILNGEHAGYLVRIDDDSENTGGYLIICWPENDESAGFDDWVANREDLDKFFIEANWNIRWLE